MLVLFIFCKSSGLGTVSKASLMSIVERNVRCAGFGAFRASCTCSVSVMRCVVVECLAQKPCGMRERGMSEVMCLRTSFSWIFKRVAEKGY